jgi:hypothetical protein
LLKGNFMKPNLLRYTLSILVMLFAILACALPGQPAQPTVDANSLVIGTAIASTAQAASQQTAVAQLSTATPSGPTGTTIEQLQDGTTRYTDYDAHFDVTYPVGWLSPELEEFNAALESGRRHPCCVRWQTWTMVMMTVCTCSATGIKPMSCSDSKWNESSLTAMLDNANMGDGASLKPNLSFPVSRRNCADPR